MTSNAIESNGLTKKFGRFTAVDHLNLEVRTGELFGLLGPNGAGKTTTVRMLCTLIEPTSGTATVAGHDIVRAPDKVRREIGVVSDGVSLYKDLSIEENLRLLSTLYGLPRAAADKRIQELLEMFNFREKAKRMTGTLSTGWMKKALICTALLHNPEILFLDEVTSGLDPQSAIALHGLTRRLCDEGVTVIWTTHYMQEPEKICDRVGVIFAGRAIQIGTPNELKRSTSELSVVEVNTPSLPEGVIDKLSSMGEICRIEYKDPLLRVTCTRDSELAEHVTKVLISSGARIKAINTKEPTLEEAFISLTGGEEEIDRFLETSSGKK